MNTLTTERVQATINHLFADQEVVEGPATAELIAKNRPIDDFTHQEQTTMLSGAYLAIPRECGDFLYQQARARNAKRIVEFGTSFGISTVFLAAAARDNGGEVITSEWHADKAATARKNMADAGLDDITDVRDGDALESLANLPGPVDMVFLDGWKDLYLPVLKVLEPQLAPNALIIADDMGLFPQQAYFDHVRGGNFVSNLINVGDGMEVSTYIA
ncbi:O-methyltransferase [Streptomyces sp. NPDC050658]|uniref:O-methyltransferase n=1 Tax=unclassified Streptomyces TaxID=2593676 RepID=UPI00344574D9